MDTKLISVNLKDVLGIALIEIGLLIVIVAFSYNAGYGDGVAKTFQEIAKCTIKDAHSEKCFIPCSTNEDCLEKNGMTDH